MDTVKSAVVCTVIATAAGIVLAHGPGQNGAVFLGHIKGLLPPAGRTAAPQPAVGRDPQPWRAASFGNELTLEPDRLGQFHAELNVEGRRIPAMVDTGASFVSLSFETAAQLGFFVAPADFHYEMRTANGVIHAAAIEIPELRVGPVTVRHVEAMVLQRGALTTQALLGMSFLRALTGFSIEGGRLVLKQ